MSQAEEKPEAGAIAQHLADSIERIMNKADEKHVVGTHSHTQAIFLGGLGAICAAIAELEMKIDVQTGHVQPEEPSRIIH